MPETFNFVIDGRILFDIGIGCRNVGLRLIVIIIGNKVFNGAVRKEFPELRTQLCSQGFIVRNDQRGALNLFDDGGHGVGFAGPGNAQQHLAGHSLLNAFGQGLNGLRLVALGLERGFENKTAFFHT